MFVEIISILLRLKMDISIDSFKTFADNYQYQQIVIGPSSGTKELVVAKRTDEESRAADLKEMQASLLSSAPVWPFDTYRQSSPYPILVTKQQVCNLEALQICLRIAITDIVERWWTDKEARYWERMPIEGHEEDLLRVRAEIIIFKRTRAHLWQWMGQQEYSTIRPYYKCRGSWRPDFLIDLDGNYRICEINGRFAFNGYLHTAYGQQAYINGGAQRSSLTIPAVEPQKVGQASQNESLEILQKVDL